MKTTEMTEATINHGNLYFYCSLHYWNLLKIKRRVQMRRRSLKSMGVQL